VSGVLETALYVDDLPRASRFYRDLFGFPVLVEDGRLCALDVASRSVLLLFRRGASLVTTTIPGGTIPSHDGSGPVHVAFAIPAEQWEAWEAKLSQQGIAIEAYTRWPLGGRSLYFRDPDHHLVELVTPGTWKTY